MEKAFALLLRGIGFPPGSPALRGLPRRVARTWITELLDGYRKDPRAILSRGERGGRSDLVMVKGISFTSMCPHHLILNTGIAHVAYVPAGRIVGLNRIVDLVDCFTHRLELQERVTEQIADALMEHLGARGAACHMESEHACMTRRGVKREGARVVTASLRGVCESDARMVRAFFTSMKSR